MPLIEVLVPLNLGLNIRRGNYIQFALLRRLCYKNKNKTSSGMITRKIEVSKVTVFEKKRPQKLFWLLQNNAVTWALACVPSDPSFSDALAVLTNHRSVNV